MGTSGTTQPWRHRLPVPEPKGIALRGHVEGVTRFRSAFEILRTLAVFAPVSDGELMKFAALGRERRIERGAALHDERRAEAPLALILEGDGMLAWSRGDDEALLRTLEPGDLVGESDLFLVRDATPVYAGWGTDEHRGSAADAAAARALTPVRLIEWDADAVREALRRWPDVAVGLLAAMARRQRDLQRRVAGLCGGRAPRRLARALAALLEERGVSVRGEGGRLERVLPRTPSRTRLGAMTGLARETVSRLLAAWTRRGWVATRGGDLVVLDGAQWNRLAGGDGA